MIFASVQFVSEASATLSRRAAGSAEDVWLKSNMYPDYYLNTFHYQVRHHMLTLIALIKAAQLRDTTVSSCHRHSNGGREYSLNRQ